MPAHAALILAMSAAATLASPPTGVREIDLSGATPSRSQESGSFHYSLPLDEGTYRVTLTLGDRRRAGRTTVKVESRRLMLDDVATRAGQTVTRSFLVAVRNPKLPAQPTGAPRFPSQVQLDERDLADADWDDKLSFEFLGTPRVSHIRIEPVIAPVIYLLGDSTVANQYTEPFASWGQMLPALFDETVAVANHAKSGATMKSFIAQLRFSKVLEQIRPGDWMFIQFGHNDQKAEWPMTYLDPATTYPAYLRTYIAEARRRGAHPVLVTSPERRNFQSDGTIKDTLGKYAQAVRDVAASERVPLIDLNKDSIAIMEALGPETAPLAFAQNGADKTHHDNYGAWLMAASVARQVSEKIPGLAAHVQLKSFDPADPPRPSQRHIEPSISADTQKPEGN